MLPRASRQPQIEPPIFPCSEGIYREKARLRPRCLQKYPFLSSACRANSLGRKQGNNSPEQGIKSADQGKNREAQPGQLLPAQSADTIPMLTDIIAADPDRNKATIADPGFRRRGKMLR
jgi:hypothetical protein